jgi:hypothetical protein
MCVTKDHFRTLLIVAVGGILWLTPSRFGAQRMNAEPTQSGVKEAMAGFKRLPPANIVLPKSRRLSGTAVPVQASAGVADQGRLRLDSQLTQSLAQTGCAIHNHSHAGAPFADVLNLPPGPYPKSYNTSAGTRFFLIVGDDCDYLGNPEAPSVRMVSAHRMNSGLIYLSLLNARGDVLALLRQTGPTQYVSLNLDQRTPEIETIYADLKLETESWNSGLKNLLNKQNQEEQK